MAKIVSGDAAIAPPGVEKHHNVDVLAEGIGENKNAITRFILVSKTTELPKPTGYDKTSLIVELPEDRSGVLLEMLEQFATRGVNLSLIQSRPIGDALGRYRFVIDAEGHVRDERMSEALGIAQAAAGAAAPTISREETLDRIRQEVTLYGIRVDVAEELTRLSGHLSETRAILKKGGQVGKRLDFMMQELNREANTLGSKAALKELSDASMQMKLLIEQMREQVQNIE